MDTIKSLEVWPETGSLHIKIARGVHWDTTVMSEGCGYSGDITIFRPTEADLFCLIKGACDGLVALRTKGE